MKTNKWLVLAICVAFLLGIYVSWSNHQERKALEERLNQLTVQLEQAQSEMIQKVEKKIQTLYQESKKAGDRVVKEMATKSDVEFLVELNNYSDIMYQRSSQSNLE